VPKVNYRQTVLLILLLSLLLTLLLTLNAEVDF
jgi:hypothetical protein